MKKEHDNKLPWWHMHRHLYDWVLHFAETKHGPTALFVLSFAESSFFPVPPDVLLAPLTLGAPKKWFRLALTCSIGSVIGGAFGFMIGFFLWAQVGDFFAEHVPGFSRDVVVMQNDSEIEGRIAPESIKTEFPFTKKELIYPLTFNDRENKEIVIPENEIAEASISPFSTVGAAYNKTDWQVVSIAGFTPIPYKVITITAGVFKINFLIFCIASALSRSARFFLVAGLFRWKGKAIKPFLDKYFNWLSLAFVALLIGGFAALKLLH